jgi:acyl-CoA thioesterase I
MRPASCARPVSGPVPSPASGPVPGRYGAPGRVRNLAGGGVIALLGLVVVALAACLAAGPAAAEVRILAFGDSLTQGHGLPEDQGFVPQLEDWLHAHGAPEASVINAGVSGDTTAGGRARIAWSLADDPDAVILELGGNDMLRGLPLSEFRGNLEAILSEIDRAGVPVLLAGVPVPANYGPDYAAAFARVYEDLAAEHDAILYPSFLQGMSSGRTLQEAMRLMQPDGIHPNAAGVEANVAAIGPVVLQLVERARD